MELVQESAPDPAQYVDETPEMPELRRTISLHADLLEWLREELVRVSGADAAEALVMGVEVVLADDSTPLLEAADAVANMLRPEGVPEEIVSDFLARAATLASK